MIFLTCCQTDSKTAWEISSMLFTVFAAIVTIGYFIRPRLYFCAYLKNNDANPNDDNQSDISGTPSVKYDKITEPVKNRLNSFIRQLTGYINHIEIDPLGEENWDESTSYKETAKEPLNPQEDKEALGIFKKSYRIVISRYASAIGSKVTIDQQPFEDIGRYCVKIENMNIFRNTIKEIRCEVAVAEEPTFSKIKTIKLSKTVTLFLRSRRSNQVFNYVFWANSSKVPEGYRFFRVRLLATNFLGVKKHYERYYELDELNQIVNQVTRCQCWHNLKTQRNIFDFVKSGIHCRMGAYVENLFDNR